MNNHGQPAIYRGGGPMTALITGGAVGGVLDKNGARRMTSALGGMAKASVAGN